VYSESNKSEAMQKLIQIIVDTENALICLTHMFSTSVISTYSCEILSEKFGSIGFHSVLLLLSTEINIIRTRHKKSQGIHNWR